MHIPGRGPDLALDRVWGSTLYYTLPGLTPNAPYIVRLHFAEFSYTAPGQRVFDVAINGTTVLTNFDIVAAAGGADKAVVEEIPATASGSGQLTILFTSVTNNAIVNAVAVVPATQPTETTSYDAEGNVVREADGNGDLTQSAYDPLGRLVAQTNPVSGTSVMTYSATEQTQLQDEAGNVTGFGYDAAGRLTQRTDPVSGTTQYGYDPVGNTVAITQADAATGTPIQVEARQYDALNRVITDTLSRPDSRWRIGRHQQRRSADNRARRDVPGGGSSGASTENACSRRRRGSA